MNSKRAFEIVNRSIKNLEDAMNTLYEDNPKAHSETPGIFELDLVVTELKRILKYDLTEPDLSGCDTHGNKYPCKACRSNS